VRVRVRVVVRMFVRSLVMMVIVINDELCRRDAGSQDARGVNACSLEREASQRPPELFERQSCVEQSTEHHVA
jgi:hypothetical protein